MNKFVFGLPVTGIILGTFIAILFGVNEGYFKDYIAHGLEKNAKVAQIQDSAEKASYVAKEEEKNWRYFQRFHFHSTGIGSMSLALLLLLCLVGAKHGTMKKIAALSISIGGFLYPFVWLFAAVYGPSLGRSVAKEKFAIFGYMGGLFLLGAVLTLILVLIDFEGSPFEKTASKELRS